VKPIIDLIKKPTFLSIVSIILFGFGIPFIIYQFFTIDESASLGITIEIIFLFVVLGLLTIDRFLIKKINNINLSFIEVIFITAYLIYYYYTHDKSFSVG
jgi:hypothetical protein